MSAVDLIPVRGRPAKPLVLTVLRELTAADLFALRADPGETKIAHGQAPLQRLRAKHHQLARQLAAGKTQKQAAAIVGMTPQRVSQLQADPTFVELVEHYSDSQMVLELQDEARIQGKMVSIAEDAIDEIQDRLDDPAKRARIPFAELRMLMADAAGRTVAPQKQSVAVTQAPQEITFKIPGPGIERDPANAQRVIEHGTVIDHEPFLSPKDSDSAGASAPRENDPGRTVRSLPDPGPV